MRGGEKYKNYSVFLSLFFFKLNISLFRTKRKKVAVSPQVKVERKEVIRMKRLVKTTRKRIIIKERNLLRNQP